MTYVVLKGYLYDPIDCVKPVVAQQENWPGKYTEKTVLFYSISIRLGFVSDPGSVSPFLRDSLLAPVLHFVSVDRGERGLGRKIVS